MPGNTKRPSFLKRLFTRKKKEEPTLNKNTFNKFVPTEKNTKIQSLKTAIQELEKLKRNANQRTNDLTTKVLNLDEKIKNIDTQTRILVGQKRRNLAVETLKRKYPLKNGKRMTAALLRSSKNISRKANLEIKRAKRQLQRLEPTNAVNQWGSENIDFPDITEATPLNKNIFDPFPQQEQWNWSVLNRDSSNKEIELNNFNSISNNTNLLNLAHSKPAQPANPFPENTSRQTRRIIGRYPRNNRKKIVRSNGNLL